MSVKPIPEGHHTVTPHLVVDGAAQALEFYVRALGAEELFRMPAPGGEKLMHAEMMVGDSHVYLCDEFPEFGKGLCSPKALGGSSVTLHLYVTDCDASIARAVAAGATLEMPATDMFWGDRYGSVRDPFGHKWSFATHTRDLSPQEMEQAMNDAFSGHGGCGGAQD